jgi:HD-GYP domain-containing protein (c-di-GMP phosphodiesterase class II)
VRTDVLHSRILYWLLAVMLAVALLPLVFVSWRLTTINRNSMSEGQRAAQAQLAVDRAREISAYFDRYLGQTASVARGLELAAGDRGLAAVDRGRLEETLHRDPNVLALGVVPAGGRPAVVWNQDRLGADALAPLVEEAVASAVEKGRYVGAPRAVAGRPVAVMADAVRAGDRALGAVVAVVDLADALDVAAEDGPRAEGDILSASGTLLYVVDGAGAVVAHPDPASAGADRAGDPLVARWLARPEGAELVSEEYRDREANLLGTVATAEVPGGQTLGVVAVADRDLAFAPSDRMAEQAVWACVFAAFVASLVAILFAGQIATPLRDLARGARAIAGGDFSHRIRVWSKNETGQLAEDFNHMAETLQENIRKMREAAETNRALFIGTVRGLAAAIDGKDPYTRGHSERVADYSAAMAIELGLPPEEVEKIRIGGLMHDLGKLAIEDAILRKPAQLTDEEFEIMREHPERGTRIMSEIPQMREYIPGMRFHHEMVNGKGYPLGLYGEQIPLMARIISVADTFDAMTTNRPYQRQMPIDLVFERIRSMTNVRYDPAVVDALVAAYEHGRIKLRLAKSARAGQVAEGAGGA